MAYWSQEIIMEATDPLSVAFAIADESAEIVNLVAVGVRTNGSLLILTTGLTDAEAKELMEGYMAWRSLDAT